MNRTLNNIVFFLLTTIMFVALPACREGIIEPGRAVGNINEPVTLKTGQVYSFQIDAQKISFAKQDKTFLDFTNTDVSLTVTNYSGGTVFLKVIGDNKDVLYEEVIDRNFNGIQESIKNHVAEIVNLSFNNFSGNMKIQLTKTPRQF